MSKLTSFFYTIIPLFYGYTMAAAQDIQTYVQEVEGIKCYGYSYQNMSEHKPLLLLVHGSPGSYADMSKYLTDNDLQKKYRLLAIDRLGYGRSGEPRAYPNLALQAKAVCMFAEAYGGLQKVILMGHSVGGPIVMRCAIDHPNSVSQLVLLAPAISAAHEQPRCYNRALANPWLLALVPKLFRISQDEMMALPEQLEAMEDLYPQMKTPTYLFHGTADMIAPYGNAVYLKEKLGESLVYFRTFKRTNHFIHVTKMPAIKEFLLQL